MKLQLVPVLEENIPVLAALARNIWNVHYPPIVGQAQVDYMLQKLYNQASLSDQMKEGQQFYFIVQNHVSLGFISVSEMAKGDYFIHKFYVNTDSHRQGIGRDIFHVLCENLQPRNFTLQVNRLNFKSINFYFKMGFIIKEVMDLPIGDGFVMNDFLMERTF